VHSLRLFRVTQVNAWTETSLVEARHASTRRRLIASHPPDPASPVVIILSIVILAVAVGLFVRLLQQEQD
jgi:hypothetical protein